MKVLGVCVKCVKTSLRCVILQMTSQMQKLKQRGRRAAITHEQIHTGNAKIILEQFKNTLSTDSRTQQSEIEKRVAKM